MIIQLNLVFIIILDGRFNDFAFWYSNLSLENHHRWPTRKARNSPFRPSAAPGREDRNRIPSSFHFRTAPGISLRSSPTGGWKIMEHLQIKCKMWIFNRFPLPSDCHLITSNHGMYPPGIVWMGACGRNGMMRKGLIHCLEEGAVTSEDLQDIIMSNGLEAALLVMLS